MADVLLVEPRQVAGLALARILVTHVPVGDQLHAVGIDVRGEDDHVAEEAQRLRIVLADQLIDRLGQLLRAEHFGGVQAAVDPHHGLAVAGQRARLVVGEALGQREAARDVLVLRRFLWFSGAVMIAIS